jgi:hypothetical protein
MTHSPDQISKWKDARWRQKRASAENVQASLVKWVDTNWRALGIPDPKLFFALAVWLGKPTKASAFYVTARLNELGMPNGGSRLALFVPRGEMLGLFLWIDQLGTREPPEVSAMKRALGRQRYECMTAFDVSSGTRIISEYMSQPEFSGARTVGD